MWWSTSSRMPTRWPCQRRPVTAVAPTCCRSTSARYTSLSLLVFSPLVHHLLSCFTVLPRYTSWSLCRITDMAADSRAWAPVTILLLHYQCMLYLCVACILLCVSGQNTSGRWGDGAHRLRVLWPSVQDAGGEAPRRHAAALGRRARSGARRPGQRPPGRQGPGKT